MFKSFMFKGARTGVTVALLFGVAAGCECSRKTDPVDAEQDDDEAVTSSAKVEEPKSVEERLALVTANCSVDTQTGVISALQEQRKAGLGTRHQHGQVGARGSVSRAGWSVVSR